MSLTLARLCGEWRFFGYGKIATIRRELRSSEWKIRSSDSDLSYSCRRLFYRGISRFWLKYEARIAIFRILAAIDRFSRISRKVESHWGKSESRWRKRKAIEESRKPLKKLESRCRIFSRISRKSESRWRKSNFVWGKLEFRRRKIPIFPRYSWVSGDFGVSFLTPDLLPRARMDLLDWFQPLITLTLTLAFQMK